MNIKNTNFSLVLSFLEGASISSCDDTITTVESDTFKYFRTQFTTVAKNRISVEVRDIEGELLITSVSSSRLNGGQKKRCNETNLTANSVFQFQKCWTWSQFFFLFFVGVSHLYASLTSTNPGPMDPASSKNESNVSPRAISLSLSTSNKVSHPMKEALSLNFAEARIIQLDLLPVTR